MTYALYGAAASGSMRALLSFGLHQMGMMKGSQAALFNALDLTISSLVSNILLRCALKKDWEVRVGISAYFGGRVVGLIVAAAITTIATGTNWKQTLVMGVMGLASAYAGICVWIKTSPDPRPDFEDRWFPII